MNQMYIFLDLFSEYFNLHLLRKARLKMTLKTNQTPLGFSISVLPHQVSSSTSGGSVHRELGTGSWSVCDANNDRPCGSDDGCNDSPDPNRDGSAAIPDGSYEMFRGGSGGCTYGGDGEGPGTLICPGWDEAVDCEFVDNPQNIPCLGSISAGFLESVYCDY